MQWSAVLLVSWLAMLAVDGAAAVPQSGVARETSCLQCHGAQGGRLGEPVSLWRQSIHAANGVSCHDCHGGDPTLLSMEAMSPERGFLGVPPDGEVPGFCGRCHVGVLEDYLGSAHGRAAAGKGPHCVTCHGNHAVVKATPQLINERDCSRCHAYGRAGEIKAAVAQTDEMIGALEAALPPLRRSGIATKSLSDELFAVRNDFHRLFHSVEIDRVRSQTAEFRRRLEAVDGKIAVVEARIERRRVAGGIIAGLFLLAGILLLLLRRTYADDERES